MADNEKEIVKILRVSAGNSATTIKELKEVISALKKEVEGTDVSTKAYEAAVQELAKAQDTLREVTTLSADAQYQVADAADKGVKSYNQLNNELRKLKTAWKATNDEAKRADLTVEINRIKDQMHGLDESIGNFQHHVGDYFNQGKKALDAFKNGLMTSSPQVEALGRGLSGLAANPVIGSIGVLVMGFTQLVGRMKETDEGQKSLNALMEAGKKLLEPVMKIVDFLVQQLGKLADWATEFITAHAPEIKSFMSSIIPKIVGVGNALLQFILTPVRTVIEAVKGAGKVIGDVFRGDWSSVKADAQAAGEAIGEAWRTGFSFKANFESGEQAGGKWIEGLASENTKAKAAEAGAAVAGEYVDAFLAELKRRTAEMADEEVAQKLLDAEIEATRSQLEAQEALKAEMWDEAAVAIQARADEEVAIEKAKQEELAALEKEAEEREEQSYRNRQAITDAFVSGTSSILGSLADVYDTQAKNDEDAERKAKALRIAGATIDTISGAIKAYMQGVATYPPPAGPIVGAANAAVVTATGLAQIAKIRATDVSATGTSNPNAQFAQVSAPAVVQEVQTVRSLTGDSEERRLDQMASNSKVYLVMSELEAKQNGRKVQMEETSF